jgi:hypothetical protein
MRSLKVVFFTLGGLSIIVLIATLILAHYTGKMRHDLTKMRITIKEKMPIDEVHKIIVGFDNKEIEEIDITQWDTGMHGTKPWKLREIYTFGNWPLDSYLMIYYDEHNAVTETFMDI